MIKDAMEWLKKHFTDQHSLVPSRLSFPKTKRKSFYWDPELRQVEELDDSPPDLRHTLTSVRSLIDYINNEVDLANLEGPAKVFVGESQITADIGLENIATMPFRKTPLWLLLERLVKEPSLKQAEAIKLVRQEFGPFDVGQVALTACRSLRIQTDSESIQESQAAKFGKSVMASTVNGENLPDKLVVEANVYQHSRVGVPINVFLSVDFNKPGCIRFEPNEAEMQDAIEAEVANVYDQLVDAFKDSETVNVYQGEYRVE